MLDNSAFDITIDDSRVTVSLDRSQVEVDELLQFVDFLRIQSFLRRNILSEEEIAALADEIKRSAWKRVKRRWQQSGKGDFLPPEEFDRLDAE